MAKTKTSFFCQQCGYESAKWTGKCPSCNAWNAFTEELTVGGTGDTSRNRRQDGRSSKPKSLSAIDHQPMARIVTLDQELNRVLGGGLVPGSLVLIGGEPGVGKSTLMLQLALMLGQSKIMYISGEESEYQLKMRAERLRKESLPEESGLYILTETDTQQILTHLKTMRPTIVIIDSIQTLHSPLLDSAAGSIGQVRQCANELLRFAKETNTAIFLVGHITKDGTLAGPKVLEHMVDTVLQFEGDRRLSYRLLRTTKNRFGSTSEIGIYEMRDSGFREVPNPSEILISQKDGSISGISIGAAIEGNRPLLIEIQSLVSPASYGTPQRTSTGFDHKRLNMLLAVLEKRCHFRMGTQDVFLNIAGGISVEDPAIDLSVCVALISSLEEISLSEKICFAAEVGLGGELRAVNRIEQRASEADKIGFEKIYISKFNPVLPRMNNIQVHAFGKIQDVFAALFNS